MMTREQAEKTWCPMVRRARVEQPQGATREIVVAGRSTDALGGDRVPASCRCIADRCAMWRWAEEPATRRCVLTDTNGQHTVEPERPLSVPSDWEFCAYDPAEGEPSCWVEPEHIARQRRCGYCGLAGRQEVE